MGPTANCHLLNHASLPDFLACKGTDTQWGKTVFEAVFKFWTSINNFLCFQFDTWHKGSFENISLNHCETKFKCDFTYLLRLWPHCEKCKVVSSMKQNWPQRLFLSLQMLDNLHYDLIRKASTQVYYFSFHNKHRVHSQFVLASLRW